MYHSLRYFWQRRRTAASSYFIVREPACKDTMICKGNRIKWTRNAMRAHSHESNDRSHDHIWSTNIFVIRWTEWDNSPIISMGNTEWRDMMTWPRHLHHHLTERIEDDLTIMGTFCRGIYHWNSRVFGGLWSWSEPLQYVYHFEAESVLSSKSAMTLWWSYLRDVCVWRFGV